MCMCITYQVAYCDSDNIKVKLDCKSRDCINEKCLRDGG